MRGGHVKPEPPLSQDARMPLRQPPLVAFGANTAPTATTPTSTARFFDELDDAHFALIDESRMQQQQQQQQQQPHQTFVPQFQSAATFHANFK
jgi:hypothetical protein